MTAVWGPLGWMTLHSVATCYPENPVQTEKELMYSWLDMFRDTITCPHCQQHFSNMLATYRASFPNMLSSRQEFVLFTFRAHNAVNRRLKKPMYSSVEECMNTLKNNIKNTNAKNYRISYINHITRHWKTFQDVTGIVAMKKINEMKKIDIEYIQPRDTNFEVNITPDVVVLPRDALEKEVEPQRQGPSIFSLGKRDGPSVGIRITAGGIRLRR
jgi:hypothetical protein